MDVTLYMVKDLTPSLRSLGPTQSLDISGFEVSFQNQQCTRKKPLLQTKRSKLGLMLVFWYADSCLLNSKTGAIGESSLDGSRVT